MGSRAGIIVIDADGSVELYYDHWAAQTLAQDAALAGAVATLERVRSMEPMGVSNLAEWTSAPWMEGAMLIDVRSRRVVWAEEGEALVLPRITNFLLERTWPGWTAIWSPEEVKGIIRLVGVDTVPLFAGSHTFEAQRLADDQWFPPGPDQIAGLPISVRLDEGDVVLWRTDSDLVDIACFDPREIVEFACRAYGRGARGNGWGENWRSASDVNENDWSTWGVHIDAPTRTLSWWATWETNPCDQEFDAYWPGWIVRTLGDDYEWHERALGGIPLQPPWIHHIAQARARFEKMIDEGPRENPFTRIAKTVTDKGHQVTPLPGVLQFIPSTGFGGASAIRVALEELADPPPLPPVRYVDRYGTVHEPGRDQQVK